ncbi:MULTISPECIES: hypothetical protein [Helcococcus]|uniref:DUF5626 domain-containing protein n=1 Tax=Helcococcus bovis TaxID=3153252 RepID=A0ABW9F5N3_9FIRM
MKKLRIILSMFALLFLFNLNNTNAIGYIVPNSIRCQPYTSYSESSVSRSQSEQFTHMAYSSPISSTVTHRVTLTSTLSLKAGVTADMNVLLAKSSINFEMGYVGSRETSTSITWNVPAGGNYKLIAGKEIADVSGLVSEMNFNCELTEDPIRVKGNYRTFHKAIGIN